MEWTDICISVPRAHADTAEAIAIGISGSGLYIEDYENLEQQIEEIAHIDLIEQELLDKPRDVVAIHMYLSPEQGVAEVVDLLHMRLLAAEAEYTLTTTGVQQEDWETSWKKYYHPIEIGKRLAIAPTWEEYESERVTLRLDPGMAFGTGTHETTFLCLEILDEIVKGKENMLDIGTGSGILAIAAILLGAKNAEGIDIDPMCVRTAKENAKYNNVQNSLTVEMADLAEKANGQYNIITANIVAAAIARLAPSILPLLAPGGRFIASGIIAEREAETVAALKAANLRIDRTLHKNGWIAIICSANGTALLL